MGRVTLRGRRKDDFESLWLITFADLMVQLMAFFALGYSFLPQQGEGQGRMGEILEAFRKELGIRGESILPGSTGLDPNRAADLERLMADLKSTEGPDEGVRLRVVSFRGSVLFDESSALVRPEFEPYLQRIAELAKDYPGFHLALEGHAAPGERGRDGGDVWALSGDRAQAVARLLTARGYDPKWIIPEARGDALLEGDAATTEGRSLARQVKFRFQRVAAR